MAGFGSQPFGSSPYGIGTPATAPSLDGSVLRDETSNATWGSRQIDPLTGDYVLDDNGRVLGMSDVKQLVFLAVKTAKGSAAMRSLGHQLGSIDRITPNFSRRVDNELRTAVQHLVNQGFIEVDSVQVTIVRPGVVLARLRWRDLLTGELEELESNVIAPGQ